MATNTVEVFFDYTCAFSNRTRHWLEALDGIAAVWRPFSLLQQNHGGSGASVFDRAEYADNVSLIALAVHAAVREAGGDIDGYTQRMFTQWHEVPGRLRTEDIVGFGRAAGLRKFQREEAFAALAADHLQAKQRGVFGTPTLMLGDAPAAFVKLDAVPPTDRARTLWETLQQLAQGVPELREFQRVTRPAREHS
ncbi:MAG: DsbA family protein [Actinomycetota bacterium]|nr:DsbA family protein [Actinomycetota bacterium]